MSKERVNGESGGLVKARIGSVWVKRGTWKKWGVSVDRERVRKERGESLWAKRESWKK